jgi:hypothetical protein
MRDHEPPAGGESLHASLRYAQPPDLGPACRSLPRVDILNTRDERVGVFDGILLSATSDNPLFLVFQRHNTTERRLIPIGEAWLDPTAKVIRVDPADVDGATPFELSEFERMTPTEVLAFERRVLASCCPEVLRGTGAPRYDTAPQFKCPEWLRADGMIDGR